MIKNSPYRAVFKRHEKRLYLGYDYTKTIMQKSLSNQMFGASPTMDKFISAINDVMFNCIEDVKQIKIFRNAAVDKYESEIN